jgi:hypothetical protein
LCQYTFVFLTFLTLITFFSGAKGKFNAFRSGGPGTGAAGFRKGGRLGGIVTTKAAAAPVASRLGDARMKIIAKKRQNLVDARDQLNEIARQSDAREKLVMLRAKKGGGKPKSLFTKALGGLKTGGAGLKSGGLGFKTGGLGFKTGGLKSGGLGLKSGGISKQSRVKQKFSCPSMIY